MSEKSPHGEHVALYGFFTKSLWQTLRVQMQTFVGDISSSKMTQKKKNDPVGSLSILGGIKMWLLTQRPQMA